MNKIGLIGHGYWGKNILRNLINIVGISNILVVDSDPDVCNWLKNNYKELNVDLSLDKALTNELIDKFIIATPTCTHFEIAFKCLNLGKNVLVEKPLTTSYKEAQLLNDLAEEKQVLLMTDYTYVYNPNVEKIKEYINSGYLGTLNYIDFTRINLGKLQKETNVLWDLACHDLSIINYLIKEKPYQIRAIARKNNFMATEELSHIFLEFQSGLLVHINSSWASPIKIRKTIIGGDKRMIIFDDLEPEKKLTIYEYKQCPLIKNNNELTEYRLDNELIPEIQYNEPLHLCILDFVNCVKNKKQPKTNFDKTKDVILLIEKANESISNGGSPVKI